MDPHVYRYYECNLEAPYMRTRTLYCKRIVMDTCITSYSGCGSGTSLRLNRFNLPALENTYISGRLSIYLKSGALSGYMQYHVGKNGDTVILTPISTVYIAPGQQVTADVDSLVIQCGISAEIGWEYSGI